MEAIGLGHSDWINRSLKPDLVIMDRSLPDRWGPLLIRQMHMEFPELPIIAMTGESAITKTDYHRLAMTCAAVGKMGKG